MFLICYAVNNIESFDRVQEEWVTEVRHNVREAKIILIGTKADRREIEDPGKSYLDNLFKLKNQKINCEKGLRWYRKRRG